MRSDSSNSSWASSWRDCPIATNPRSQSCGVSLLLVLPGESQSRLDLPSRLVVLTLVECEQSEVVQRALQLEVVSELHAQRLAFLVERSCFLMPPLAGCDDTQDVEGVCEAASVTGCAAAGCGFLGE